MSEASSSAITALARPHDFGLAHGEYGGRNAHATTSAVAKGSTNWIARVHRLLAPRRSLNARPTGGGWHSNRPAAARTPAVFRQQTAPDRKILSGMGR